MACSASSAQAYGGYYSGYTYYPSRSYYASYYYYKPYRTYPSYHYHYCVYYPRYPRYVYYYNPYRKVYWGRYDLDAQGLLAAGGEGSQGEAGRHPRVGVPQAGRDAGRSRFHRRQHHSGPARAAGRADGTAAL